MLEPGEAGCRCLSDYEDFRSWCSTKGNAKVWGTDPLTEPCPGGLGMQILGLVRWAGADAGGGGRISKDQRTTVPFFLPAAYPRRGSWGKGPWGLGSLNLKPLQGQPHPCSLMVALHEMPLAYPAFSPDSLNWCPLLEVPLPPHLYPGCVGPPALPLPLSPHPFVRPLH